MVVSYARQVGEDPEREFIDGETERLLNSWPVRHARSVLVIETERVLGTNSMGTNWGTKKGAFGAPFAFLCLNGLAAPRVGLEPTTLRLTAGCSAN